jgi:hypothetical protein
MGREIRRVPPDWQHPRDEQGHHKPLYDWDYDTEAQEWIDNLLNWLSDENSVERKHVLDEYEIKYYWDWDGGPPSAEYCRPAWTDEQATHYQIYETVSEGTPTSPVFASLDDMCAWLIEQGYTETAARRFCKDGWAPSMMISPTKGISPIGIASLDWLPEPDND